MPDEMPHTRDESLPVDPDIEDPRGSGAARRNFAAIRRRWDILVAVAVGGMIGAVARYALSLAMPAHSGQFPWGTFITNISGSLVLGFIMVLLAEYSASSRYARPFFGTGVIGAYTTFSTYVVEADLLVRDGHSDIAAAYALGSLVCGLLAVWAGIVLGRRVTRALGGPPTIDHPEEGVEAETDAVTQHEPDVDALQ